MKYFIFTLGCQMNESDAERILAVLEKLNFKQATSEQEADLIITLACSVRQKAVDRIWGRLKKWQKIKEKHPLITILSGCVLAPDKKKFAEVFDLVLDINEITKSPKKLLDHLKKYLASSSGLKIADYFKIHPKYQTLFSAYVPIMTGCNNFCTYCAVPYTRGPEKSRPKKEIIEEIKNLIKNNYKSITLLGQNVNSYGQDFLKNPKKSDNKYFIDLLFEINKIPGNFWFYFITNHPKDMSNKLIEALPSLGKLGHYIHLPLQSGDDKILKTMNRYYSASHYLKLIEKIKKALNHLNISTDIIVGFPGEKEKQFQNTAHIMEKAEFDMAYIAQYSPRPGTASYKLKDNVSKKEKGHREKVLTQILTKTALQKNEKIIGQVLDILVEEYKNGYNIGHTKNFKNIRFAFKMDFSGEFVRLKVTKATPWALEGEIVR
jgi:tRNA-2-methylthio-N6-dimethylallyladenosine synthase